MMKKGTVVVKESAILNYAQSSDIDNNLGLSF